MNARRQRNNESTRFATGWTGPAGMGLVIPYDSPRWSLPSLDFSGLQVTLGTVPMTARRAPHVVSGADVNPKSPTSNARAAVVERIHWQLVPADIDVEGVKHRRGNRPDHHHRHYHHSPKLLSLLHLLQDKEQEVERIPLH